MGCLAFFPVAVRKGVDHLKILYYLYQSFHAQII